MWRILNRLIASYSTFLQALCVLSCCALLTASGVAAHQTRQDVPATSPETISDFAVGSGGKYADTLFLADAKMGGIYYYRVTPESPRDIKLGEFRLLLRSEQLRRPSVLAYHEGTLLVYDKGNQAISEVDLDTLAVKALSKGVTMADVSSVAVSERGALAVASEDSEEVVIYEQSAEALTVVKRGSGAEEARRLVFDGDMLLVLNDDGDILSANQASDSKAAAAPRFEWLLSSPEVGTRFGKVKDFGYRNGILYVSNAQQIGVVAGAAARPSPSPSSATSLVSFSIKNANPISPSRVVVSNAHLFVGDEAGRVIWKLPRPTPIEVRLENTREKSSAALVSLYRYMHARGLLPVVEKKAADEPQTVEQMLLDAGVLLAPLRDGASGVAREQLGQLICALNPAFCGQPVLKGDTLLKRRITDEQKLLLPDLPLSEYVGIARIDLAGKSVMEHLGEKLPSADLRQKYATVERLSRLNGRDLSGTTQTILSQSSGQVLLPIMRWRLSALVNAEDLANDSSELRQLASAFPGIRLLSKESSPISPAMLAHLAPPPTSVQTPPTLNDVKQNRDRVRNIINFPTSLPNMSDTSVGVAESLDSIDFSHPAFIDTNGESAWVSSPEDEQGCPPLPPASGSGGGSEPIVKPASEFFKQTDHGTHITGILAARPGALVAGLLPTVKLFAIKPDDEAILFTATECAIRDRDVFIFNYSIDFDGNKFKEVASAVGGSWSNRLFVVAAGNEGLNFMTDAASTAPVVWMSTLTNGKQNIIGVGASTLPANPDDIDIMAGSNFGKKYVQLVAPGRSIFSTTRGNAYVEASGTSQATPQVTAAAALLFAQGIREPARIKARLIYTAEWLPALQNKVWGGLLHVSRATQHTNRNILTTQSDTSQVRAITLDGDFSIKVRRGKIDNPEGGNTQIITPLTIPFSHVLRIRRQNDSKFRVIYIDRNTRMLTILFDVELEGTIRCREYQELGAGIGELKRCRDDDALKTGISATQVFDYIAKAPSNVSF
jgi:hypothetical protein